ncbi:ABC transporter [Popillia japonica]|uniref:ABC transporter n=1 Tax=Popillia japonica TaxID=7064 RepID=A0AAW1KNH9_POPJA
MDPGFKVTNRYPRKDANIISMLFFVWMMPYFYKGVRKGIDANDLFVTQKADDSVVIGDQLQEHWEKQLEDSKRTGKPPSLVKAIAKTFLWSYMIFGIIMFIQVVGLRAFQPQVLGFLLRLFTGAASVDHIENTALAKYLTALVLILVVLISAFIMHHTSLGQQIIGMRIRIAVSTLIYRKMLKLSQQSLGETAAGKVVNLLANDVVRFDFVTTALHYFWITPIQVILISYLMWDVVGISSLSGILGMVVLTLPIQFVMGILSSKFRGKVAVRTDYRVRLMNEIISGIQVIKMYAWEKPFEKLVRTARFSEVKMVKYANYVRAVFMSSMVFIERTTLYLTLITFVLTGNSLTSDVTYILTPYFNTLQMGLAIFLPLAIQMVAEALVSIRRITEFLLLDERKETTIIKTDDKAIRLKEVTARWTENSGILKDLTFNVPAGKLCALIGPVGAGKSSTLQLLLGELPSESGEIILGGNISYASQEPWLFGSSVKGNILFGQEFDRRLYNKVVKVCALEKDFKQFPYGDTTLVGERGVSLSGGQRARINLARAVYRQADIYLLDDPLSAVDTHVGKHLFEECIMGFLGSKTRILVTHQLQFLKRADLIIVYNNGKIEAQGTFAELSKANTDFTKMLIAADETSEKAVDVKRPLSRQESVVSTGSTDAEEKGVAKQMEEEVIIPSKSVLWDYIAAAGTKFGIIFLFTVIIVSQVVSSGTDYFVSWWTEQEEGRYIALLADELITGVSNFAYTMLASFENAMIDGLHYMFNFNNASETPSTRVIDEDGFFNTHVAIYIYSGLIVGLIALTVLRSFLFFRAASNSSKKLHTIMFNCLLKTPMRFFDTNPSGRILNRFSKDTGAMDESLPRILSEAMQIMLVIVGAIVLICIANYWMTIPIVLLLILFYFMRGWYMLTAKDVKHVEGIAKSPVFSLLNSTLSGISTIRSSNYQGDLIKEFDGHQNVHTSAWILSITCMAAFGLWLDLLCTLFVAATAISFVIMSEASEDNISGAFAGLAISQSLSLAGMLQYGMRQTAEVVNQLISVERIMTYTKLDQEGPFDSTEGKKPRIEWPDKGNIRFQNMSLRYAADEDPVLKNLDIQIYPGEKIGIVGRTGAGKSSLISALFRLAPLEGSINIDDLDTQTIGLHDVRSKISIIPQEPVLFSAPMRYNLDPFNEYSDQDLWAALAEVELKEAVPSLDYKVAEGGSNFSVGQRQLICLARAIVRNNKILVLDEATANVDPRTDGLIQATIRRKFKDCTVLTIAHRLNTIMDSDKVLVMDTGRVAEFDHPHVLLQNPEGSFTKLVMETGASMTATLREIAQTSYNEKHQKTAL